jgi:LAO/AO transport system kinase
MMLSSITENLIDRMSRGDKIALARLISLIEECSPETPDVMEKVSQLNRKARRVGITGAGGAGKSTLINSLIHIYRREGSVVGVITIDPSSILTGGAILGDRIRMQDHYLDKGVFIRSMATRGCCGGLCTAASDVVKLMEAFGCDSVIIETTGVGQTEIEIIRLADIVVAIMVPGYGDSIQLMKAGLIEIADIFVINKADREGADILKSQLEDELMYTTRREMPSVVMTEANTGKGIEALYNEIERILNKN